MAELQTILAQLQQGVGYAAGQARKALEATGQLQGDHALIQQELERQRRELQAYANVASRITGASSSGMRAPDLGLVKLNAQEELFYIDQIPGRRIPFDLTVTLPVLADGTGDNQQTDTISQDGPFVAVMRYMTFQSALQFTRIDPESGATAGFQGRSFGRFRPPHSAWDLHDAGIPYQVISALAFPGTGAPVYASPSNHSNFRTMEFDALVEFFNQGSAWPRQRIPVPSTFWSTQINAPFQLGALDFFERGETLQWRVTPTHLNNPTAGNASAFGAGGVFPFLPSQYDLHEGIVDPELLGVGTDPITRLPNGFVHIGFHGFRIIQPPGPIRLT